MRFEIEVSKEGVDKLLDCILKNKLEYERLNVYERKKGESDTIFNPNLTPKAGDFGSCLTPTIAQYEVGTTLLTQERSL